VLFEISDQNILDLRGDLGVLGLFYFIHEGDALAFEHLVPAVFRGGGPFGK
jgi:hypothetical protein